MSFVLFGLCPEHLLGLTDEELKERIEKRFPELTNDVFTPECVT